MSLATGLGIAATGLSVFSQLRQGKQQQEIFEFNAAINQQKAQIAREAGRIAAGQIIQERTRLTKAQTAAFGASGVGPSGTPFFVKSDSLVQSEFELLVNDYNTRIGITNALAAAELDKKRGKEARTASFINAGTTLLTAASAFSGSKNIPTFNTPNVQPTSVGFGQFGVFGGGTPGPTSFGGAPLNI